MNDLLYAVFYYALHSIPILFLVISVSKIHLGEKRKKESWQIHNEYERYKQQKEYEKYLNKINKNVKENDNK